MIRFFYTLALLSLGLPNTFSRIITTIDIPSSYTFEGTSLETGDILFSQDYDNKIGINIAYQQIVYFREKFSLYAGGEFMLGKKSESKIAFHSMYISPSFLFKEKIALSGRVGITQINTDQPNFNLDRGILASIGLEYKVSDDIILGFDYCFYDIKNKTITDVSNFNSPITTNIDGDNILIEPVDLDLSYQKLGFSIIYAFTNNKKEKKL